MTFLFVSAILSALIWYDTEKDVEQNTHKALEELYLSLHDIIQLSHARIETLQTDIRASDYSTKHIYELLRAQVNSGHGIVRFGWSNENMQLVAGSSTGIYEPPIDVSGRGYIEQARNHPNHIFISEVMQHIRTGRDLFIIYSGITDKSAHYRGTIVASINIPPLIHLISRQMSAQPIDYSVYAPRGDHITGNSGTLLSMDDPSLIHYSEKDGFMVAGSTNATYMHGLWIRHLLISAALTLIGTCLLSLAYSALNRAIIKPVESTVAALSAYLPHSVSISLHDKLQRIQTLAAHYSALQEQLHHSEKQLIASHQLVEQLQEQNTCFMQASSQQMNHTFSAIAHYSEHMEEMIIAQRMDEDHRYYFDDVKEMGDNLHLAATAFYHLCEIRQGLYQPMRIKLNLHDTLHERVNALQDALDRRNQNLHFAVDNTPHDAAIYNDPSTIGQLLHCVLYSAIHFAEDEATLNIALTPHKYNIELCITLSHYRRSVLSPEEQDFGAFMTSMKRDVSDALRKKINGYMNICIAQSYLAMQNSKLDVQVNPHTGAVQFIMHLADDIQSTQSVIMH